MTTILLAGASASGKSTLARALSAMGARYPFSTSTTLRAIAGPEATPQQLYAAGCRIDNDHPDWLLRMVQGFKVPVVVDAVRSKVQDACFLGAVRVNVVANLRDIALRHGFRHTEAQPTYYEFDRPDFVWDSSRVSLSTAVVAINQLCGGGRADAIIGGQYGSEGKGKLAALLAPDYDWLVRSGGPNAGHWVRDESYEFCYHHLPSGTLANKTARIAIAAGAALGKGFADEVLQTGCVGRLYVDPNTIAISDYDVSWERDNNMVGNIGSTAQGVGYAQAKRIMRGGLGTPESPPLIRSEIRTSQRLEMAISSGEKVLIEGTQGSALSLYHGNYPYVTSRDTNTSGLLAEVGMAPCMLRDTWLVLRTFPIRVGGNSGDFANETSWEEVARTSGQPVELLRKRELTSTTKRQRRVANFDFAQVAQAIELNRPTRLFVTFADYLSPNAGGVTEWSQLPPEVHTFCDALQLEFGVPVAGVSTGRTQRDVAWSGAYL